MKPQLPLLYIDDTEADVELMRIMLSRYGMTLKAAATGQEGLTDYHPAKYSAVIVDWNLPDRDGLDIISDLLRRYPQCPVALISGALDEEKSAAAAEMGVECFEKSLNFGYIEHIRSFANRQACVVNRKVTG